MLGMLFGVVIQKIFARSGARVTAPRLRPKTQRRNGKDDVFQFSMRCFSSDDASSTMMALREAHREKIPQRIQGRDFQSHFEDGTDARVRIC